MATEFTIRSVESEDPGRIQLRMARDKIQTSEASDVKILRQLPDSNAPKRLLVSAETTNLHQLLEEFEPAVQIEENKRIEPF